jgi:hypothetical protein
MPTSAPTAKDIQARVRAINAKIIDAIEHTVDQVQTQAIEPPAPLPLAVARRQIANILGAPQLCRRRRCRRTKTCDGEPVHCLSVCLPALPDGVLMRILSVKAMRQRMRRR